MTNVKRLPPLGDVHALLRSLPLFESLGESVVEQLVQPMYCQALKAGETLFREGDAANYFYLVLDGVAEVMRFGLNGDERLFGQFTHGKLIAIGAMFMPHARYPMTARASNAGDALLLRLERSRIQQLCMQNPPLAMRMLENLSQKLYARVNEVEWLVSSTSSQRLAAYFMKQYDSQPGRMLLHLPMSQRQLATSLGMRAETLNRLLTDWLQRGYVRGRQRSWEVMDEQSLRNLSREAKRAF